MKLIINIFLFVFISLSANEALATGNMIPIPFSDSDAFVKYPAVAGFGVGGLVGAVIGVPVAIVAGTGALVSGGSITDTAQISFWISAIAGGCIVGAIIGAPLWVIKQVFYDLPKKAFDKTEPELKSEPDKV
jgi:hypothetical protein